MHIDNALNRRNNNFDTIRFLAATIVIYSHAFPLTGNTEPNVVFYKGSYGSLGVGIFLLLSGFLVAHSWFRTKNLLTFLKSRILRIFPALIVVLLFSSFILGPIVTSLSLKEYFSNIQTYAYLKMATLYNVSFRLPGVFNDNPYSETVNGSLWTLEYEFTFYIILAILGSTKLIYKKPVIILLFSTILSLYTLNAFDGKQLYTIYATNFFGFASFFTVGVLYYIYREYIPLSKSFAYICAFILFLSAFFGGLNHTLFLLFGTYLIMYIGLSPNMRLPKLSKYGDFSYGLYIYAFPCQQFLVWLYDGNMHPLTNFFLSFLLALSFSYLSWHLVEKPCIKLKNYSFLKNAKKESLIN